MALLQLLTSSNDAAFSSLGLLCVFDPADELIAGERGDVIPSNERRRIGDQHATQVVGQLVHDATGHLFAAHASTLADRLRRGAHQREKFCAAHTLPEEVVKKPQATLVTEGSVMLMKWPCAS